MKAYIKCFSFNNLLQNFKFMKSIDKITMDVCWNNRRKESVYFNNRPLLFKQHFHEFKALKKVIKTETSKVDFHDKFIKFGLFHFFLLSSYSQI